uniref:Ral transcription factor IIIC subunit 1 n=1 Tax=Oryzias melastigma TaxID=30732 RepID=A0A3B3DUL6_ORYME
MDALSIVADEVALEGLDGITIPTIWIRLGDVQPKFPLKLDAFTKEFIWKSLVNNRNLKFYELPQERPDVLLFADTDSEICLETHVKFEDDFKNIYPVYIIPENKDGIQGSCLFFKERKEVTKQIRSSSLAPLLSLEEASKKYGRKLVIVASQALRFRALIGAETDPDLKILNESYCLLERVGRARWQGELQSNLHGRLFMADARKLHYLRKPLVKHDLITLQPFVKRLKSGQMQHTILLLLKRFHLNRSVVVRCARTLGMHSNGFLVDEGRQRTTKYLSHKFVSSNHRFLTSFFVISVSVEMNIGTGSFSSDRCVGVSDQVQRFAQEHERNKRLYSAANKSDDAPPKTHETYRGLKRKNLIVEAVQNLKVIEGCFPLQKMIINEEKEDGINSKCCKKTINRLIQSMSKQGLLKIYSTTVIQEGITKKVDLIVHPSIQPNDEKITKVIDQIRFNISNTFYPEGGAGSTDSSWKGIFYVSVVRGMAKSYGYQPKMCRLRVLHTFLWHVIYGHPLLNTPPDAECAAETTQLNESDLDGSNLKPEDNTETSGASSLYETLGEEEEELTNDQLNPESDMKVYMDEESWKRFVPPVHLQKGFRRGWAMVGDLLLCMPLSIFVQILHMNFKVDGLEGYLSDPVKQHYLVRMLPYRMKRQLFYRQYMHSFNESLQKLIYMGLLQFGVGKKFMERDQVFVYLKRNATIVDTTNTEPHYWLVTEPPDKPFERRRYTFNTIEDVDSFWFDLMCICLNTPLGKNLNNQSGLSDKKNLSWCVFVHSGSFEVCDDGSIPGDGRGAGGLDSEFFSHLKRNWFWTNRLLLCKAETEIKMRLQNFVNKPLTAAVKAGNDQFHVHNNSCWGFCSQVGVEPASRNQRVIGGKGQKRNRLKKEIVKVPLKKKIRKRSDAHDEADHKALKKMTKQRVYWSAAEDALVMLCSVASYLLNSKLQRPFVPYCVVRDMLHAEFKISEDKTSSAVARRSRCILKNPQTLLNYRICLAEAQQDKSLMKCLEEKKPANPDKDCAKVFSEYVKLLRQKFSSVVSTHSITIPDSKQQLLSRYKTMIKCTRMPTMDIHSIVLYNLIQSTLAMSNAQMKSSRSFQTFHMYNKYDQDLLCQVFLQCRKRRLINRRRLQQTPYVRKNRGMPILPMSYQLSQSFYRWFSWRFPQSLCTDSFCFLRNDPPESSVDPAPNPPPDVSDMLQFSLSSPGGTCASALSLMTLGLLNVHVSIPKPIVVVDSTMVDNDFVKSMAALEEEDDDEDDDGDNEKRKKLQITRKCYATPNPIGTLDRHKFSFFFFFLDVPSLDLTKCGPSLLPPILTSNVCSPSCRIPSAEECDSLLIQEKGYTQQDIEACAQLRRSIDEAGEKGLDEREMFSVFVHLLEPQTGRSKTLHSCFKSWLTPRRDALSFISRPWRLIDGSVNRSVCKGMLEGLLHHIMAQPGLTQQALLEHYRNVLQPVAALDLVQALVELGCVVKKTLVKDPKPSLFGSTTPQPRTKRSPAVEEPDEVYYEPTISCCLRLSRVLPNERPWNDCL